MEGAVDLQQLLKVQHVSVVQAVDLDGLAGLLKQLLQGQKEATELIQRQQAEIDALKAAQADQQQGTDAVASGTTPADEADAAASPPSLQDQLSDLSRRLSDLEAIAPTISHAGQSGPSTDVLSGPTSSAERSAQDGAHTAADGLSTPAAAAAMPAQTGSDQDPADLQELKKQQQQLAQQLADVAAAHKGLQQQVSALGDSKADRADVWDMLSEGLRCKADSAAVNQLKSQLGGKADRSELDALLNAMSGSGSPGADSLGEAGGAAGADPAAAEAGAADAQGARADAAPNSGAQEASGDSAGAGGSRRDTRDREGAGDVAQQLSKLQLQVALLQDRVNKKADGQTVADLSDSLASTNNQMSDLAAALQDMQQQLGAAQAGLNSLQDSLSSHAAGGAMHAGSAQQAAGQHAGQLDPSTAQGAQIDLLSALAAKVSALESALPGLQAALAARQQPRRVSGEMSASSKLVQALAAQLADLGAQVSRLAAQSPSTGSSQSPDTYNAAADSGMVSAGCKGAGGAAGAAAPPSAGFGVELAAELDGRLSDLEGLVQDLALMKGDQAGMQELRALLADTATQADTDQIRQRLTSQQSLLDHLARQLSTLSSSHISNRGSRPQSAAGGGAHHSSHGAGTPASAEYNFFGGAAGAAAGSGADAAPGFPAGAHLPAGAADAGAAFGGDHEGVLGAMQAQLAAHQDSLEQLVEAISLLATGQAAAVPSPAAAATAAGTGFAGVRGALGALQVESEDGVDLATGRSDGTGEGSVPETPNLRFQHAHSLQQAAAAGAAGLPGGAGAAGAGRPGTQLGDCSLSRSQSPSSISQLAAGAGAGAGGAGLGSQWDRQAGFLQPSAATAAAVAGAGPQVARLKRLLQTGQVGRKMDWFDPALLQKMAQRLAAIDAMLRIGAAGGSAVGPQAAAGDLEGKLRRLASDVRHLKDRMAELLGAAGLKEGGLRALGQASDGDHSMLSGKPLGGYRCMACDRPLATLDSRPGPHLPTGQLPVSLSSGAEAAVSAGQALGKLPPASTGARKSTADSPAAHTFDPMLVNSPDGNKRAVGPQNWYTSVHGLPAEQLPKGDVGPHLPPGGWRGSQPLRGEDGAPVLPSVHRGSTAGGSGATPRAADRFSSQSGPR